MPHLASLSRIPPHQVKEAIVCGLQLIPMCWRPVRRIHHQDNLCVTLMMIKGVNEDLVDEV